MSKFKLNLIAPINGLGYGIHARGIIKGLAELGYDDYFLSGIGPRQDLLSAEEIALTNKLSQSAWDRSAPCVKLWHEFEMNDLSGSRLIAYPVWETSKICDKAVHDLRQMDAVFVTSAWGKQVMQDNIGTDVPIYVVNEAGQEFHFEEEPEKFPIFTFLHVGKYERRKCTVEIIKEYVEVFSGHKDHTRLIMHCFNPFDQQFLNTIYRTLKHLGLSLLPTATDPSKVIAYKGNAVVEIPKTKMSKEDLFVLYKRSHVGLYPSRGEGWNLDLFESIVNGMPCVASFATAHTEYTTKECNYPQELLLFKGKDEPAADGIWFRGDRGTWVAPDVDEFREKMLYAYTNYDNIMRDFNPSTIKERFTWKNAAKQFVSALIDINPEWDYDLPVNLEIEN